MHMHVVSDHLATLLCIEVCGLLYNCRVNYVVVLKTEKTRVETTPEICPHCNEFDLLEQVNNGELKLTPSELVQLKKRVEQHKKVVDKQLVAYMDQKALVKSGTLPLLVVQDFSQVCVGCFAVSSSVFV